MRLAWNWALDNNAWEQLDRVLHTMTLFFFGRSMLQEGIETMRELGDKLEQTGQSDTRLYWRTRLREGWFVERQGDYELAWRL